MSFVDAYTDFIFIEDQPEQADMIFLPGSAEGALPVRAAQLWKEGYAPLVLPSGKYSKLTGYFLQGMGIMRPSGIIFMRSC